ncbi:MAG TPA: hypothetical protein VIM99_06455 [Blastocatellia bacterium]
MDVFAISEYDLPAATSPAGWPEREPAIESVAGAYDCESCGFEPARVTKTLQARVWAALVRVIDHTVSADQCIQASHFRG